MGDWENSSFISRNKEISKKYFKSKSMERELGKMAEQEDSELIPSHI